MTRKLVIELSDHTFQVLEGLAFGLMIEDTEGDPERRELRKREIWNKTNDDFAPGVRELLTKAAGLMSAGTFRPGCWEREVLASLTGYEGTFNRGMLGPLALADVKLYEPIYGKKPLKD